jgi:hypothetical protein
MDCRNFRDNHLAFLDDALAPAELAAMREHVAECTSCSTHDTAVRRGLLLVRNLPSIQPSADFSARLNARLNEACARDAVRRAAEHLQRAPGIGLFAATAAGLLAASLFLTAVVTRPVRDIVMAPVVANHPEPQATVSVNAAQVATFPASVPVWPTALLVEQAHAQFAETQFQLASWR